MNLGALKFPKLEFNNFGYSFHQTKIFILIKFFGLESHFESVHFNASQEKLFIPPINFDEFQLQLSYYLDVFRRKYWALLENPCFIAAYFETIFQRRNSSFMTKNALALNKCSKDICYSGFHSSIEAIWDRFFGKLLEFNLKREISIIIDFFSLKYFSN